MLHKDSVYPQDFTIVVYVKYKFNASIRSYVLQYYWLNHNNKICRYRHVSRMMDSVYLCRRFVFQVDCSTLPGLHIFVSQCTTSILVETIIFENVFKHHKLNHSFYNYGQQNSCWKIIIKITQLGLDQFSMYAYGFKVRL